MTFLHTITNIIQKTLGRWLIVAYCALLFALHALLNAKLGARAKKVFFPASSRKTRIISGSALLLALCAFGAAGVAPMAPDASDLPVHAITEELALPSLSEQLAALDTTQANFINEERVRFGDTLSTLLQRLGVQDAAAASFIRADPIARDVLQIRPGKRIQAEVTANGELQHFSSTFINGRNESVSNLIIKRTEQGFQAEHVPGVLERRIEMRTGIIHSSLFATTDLLHIPDTITLKIVDMFSTHIDFTSDLRRGDRFRVLYETYWQNGEYIHAGRVLAGEFMNNRKLYQAVWFEDSPEKGGYYSFDGTSLKKAFLKYPLEFSRISSGFAMRKHPISGLWKQHKGVDFAAATGTPIRASGNGVIDFVGEQRGYGNVVIIKHWNNYSTLYAHMSRFAGGLRKGTKVSQGDVIGYVGATGWATGPHLHYEFRINNVARNPMTIDIPNAQPLNVAEKKKFDEVVLAMQQRLSLLAPESFSMRVASRQ